MNLNNIKQMKKDRGFTIVELLIVIVIIAVLAAITIVAYTGITSRAKTASALSNANAVAKKAEAYAADGTTSKYPLLPANLTDSSASGKTWQLTGNINFLTAIPTSSSTTNDIWFLKCAAATAASQAAITSTNISGNKFGYYDYAAGAAASVSVGDTTSCPANLT